MKKAKDLIGLQFGKWTVIADGGYKNGTKAWLCRCSCENQTEKIVNASSLLSGDSTSCGCGYSKAINLTGQKFGRWKVISRVENDKFGETYWECICDCGNTKIVNGNSLRRGISKSCGCLRVESRTKHGLSYSRLRHIHAGIKARCYNKNKREYKYYGGRGITVCDEWMDEENGIMNFYNWSIANGYEDNLSIDRINVNGNYEPNNCRWATNEEQVNNRRNTKLLTINGITHSYSEWCKISGIKYSTLDYRIRRGWSEEDLLKSV